MRVAPASPSTRACTGWPTAPVATTRHAFVPTPPTDAVPVLDELLRDLGYQPAVDDAGAFTLTNCPFHRLAETQRDIVCTMNLDYLTGCLEGLGIDGARTAVLDPRPGRCCVRVAPGAGA